VLFQSIDAVAFVGQVNVQGRRVRRVKEIIEVVELESETDNLLTNQIFKWDPRKDTFNIRERSFILESIADEIGQDVEEIMYELQRKSRYIELMDGKDVSYYKQVSKAINLYYVDPEKAIIELENR
jgi:flagellar protein FlaI